MDINEIGQKLKELDVYFNMLIDDNLLDGMNEHIIKFLNEEYDKLLYELNRR